MFVVSSVINKEKNQLFSEINIVLFVIYLCGNLFQDEGSLTL